MLYHLSISRDYAPYLETEWSKQTVTNRGLLADDENDESIPENRRKTAVQKKIILERMLALIAQFAPPLLRNEIIKRSTSLASIWQRIRKHYNFSQSEVNFLSLANIERKPDERYETFYQRIMAHIEDNLLTVASNLEYDGEPVDEDEAISPTTERLVVYLWLYLIDRRLPMYVGRVYAHELQTKTLKDIQPILSQSMNELLAELNAHEDINVQYSKTYDRKGAYNNPKFDRSSNNYTGGDKQRDTKPFGASSRTPASPGKSCLASPSAKSCLVCKMSGRKHEGHDVNTCYYLSPHDKMQLSKSLRAVTFSV